MTWVEFYLLCLIVGVTLSTLSLVMGALHIHLPGHWGGFHFGGHTHLSPGAHHQLGSGRGADLSVANFSAILLFLVWFGGAGMALRGALHLPALVALGGALAAGLCGAYVVFVFVRQLVRRDHSLKAGDFSLPGTLATITLAIRAGGTGEIGYVQAGSRKSAAARSDDGTPIPLATEVIVTRFVDGIAFVRVFQERKLEG
jgi:membrane protein implicated in regulation of membrane protease activity